MTNNLTPPAITRHIGLDFGLARIGIAVSDQTKIIASPLSTLKTEKSVELTVIKLIKELEEHQKINRYRIEKIIIGFPLLMSGKTGFLADEVKNFVEVMKLHCTFPIIFWDERLTSVQAERSLRQSNLTRKRRTQLVDPVAAAIILQNFLDSQIS